MPTTLTLQPTGQVLTVPTSWADVTLQQFVALHAPEPGDERTAAEVLLNLPSGGLDQLAAQDVPYLANLLAFATDSSPVLELLPSVEVADPGALPWGCLLLVQQHFQAHPDRPDLFHLPRVLAIYRAQLTWGNTNKVAAIEQALLASPVTEVYAEGAAFFGRCRQLSNGTSPTRQTTTSPPTKNSTPTPTRPWLSGLGLPWHWMRRRGARS